MSAAAPSPKSARRSRVKKPDEYEAGPVITNISHYFLKNVRVLDGFRLCLRFRDDFVSELDFGSWIHAKRPGPMMRPLAEDHYFKQVYLDHGALTWPNGFDIDPCAVRHWAEQGFCD